MADDFRRLLAERADAVNVALTPRLMDKLEAYYRLLVHWNARINLTSLALEPAAAPMVERLFVEPLIAAHLIAPHVSVWFDLGSGGGSPAIPLQLQRPAQRLVMVESRERKAAFLREAIRELGLTGAEVEGSRIETVAANARNAGLADLVSVRAVKMDATLFSQVQTLLRFGGEALLFGVRTAELDLPRGLEVSNSDEEAHRLLMLRRTGV